MPDQFCSHPLSAGLQPSSPLTPYLTAFAASLREGGYPESTRRSKLRLVEELGRWLDRQGLGVAALDEELVSNFLRERRRAGRSAGSHATTARQCLAHLRRQGVVASPPPPARAETLLLGLLGQYERHLRAERGLTTATVENYLPLVERFLEQRFGEGPLALEELSARDSSRFLLRHARFMSPGRARLLVTALRSFFRFLLEHGHIELDLASSVPAVAGWRLSSVPRYLKTAELQRLLDSLDRTTPTGRRNYAVLLLLARLGLRAGEVVTLELEDIDWRAGQILVRGKGLRHDRLPLPPEVGEALAAYLRADRPPGPSRRVFLCLKAPWRGLAGSSSVSSIVRRALSQAGLCPPSQGAHLLRHSLATGMLTRGASMAEVGELLRHRASTSTEIYAKVDFQALRFLAQPWPGEEEGR
ncbi:MAG: hypothetical protein A2W26_05560 [Acidobacteria bacterium RBG_16_64_8]|nr:MAG: hypothetical protein A2W26_05560 [Acidobacteria bacterium RBG_16_64_8]